MELSTRAVVRIAAAACESGQSGAMAYQMECFVGWVKDLRFGGLGRKTPVAVRSLALLIIRLGSSHFR